MADSDGTVARVEFFQGANLIATRTTPPYSILWTGVAAGSYSLTARVTDNQGASVTSTAVSVTVNTGVAQLYFIHADHLNTPRLITNQVGQPVWRFDNTDPFGGNVPDDNPSGLGAFTCNLRFPGTYADKETGTLYNWHRNLDPARGQYLQAEPLGLAGDINLYRYAINNPLSVIDPTGEDPRLVVIIGGTIAVATAAVPVGCAIKCMIPRSSASGSTVCDPNYSPPTFPDCWTGCLAGALRGVTGVFGPKPGPVPGRAGGTGPRD